MASQRINYHTFVSPTTALLFGSTSNRRSCFDRRFAISQLFFWHVHFLPSFYSNFLLTFRNQIGKRDKVLDFGSFDHGCTGTSETAGSTWIAIIVLWDDRSRGWKVNWIKSAILSAAMKSNSLTCHPGGDTSHTNHFPTAHRIRIGMFCPSHKSNFHSQEVKWAIFNC